MGNMCMCFSLSLGSLWLSSVVRSRIADHAVDTVYNWYMRYREITSPSNHLIKETLNEKKRGTHDNLFIEGHRLIEMAIASGAEIRRVFFTSAYRVRNERFLRRLSKRVPDLIETTAHILSKLTETETPQGIVAVAAYRLHKLNDLSLKANPLIVVCDGIQDPGNLGTIIRTSDAAQADAVITLRRTCDVFMPKVIRATAGSIFNIPVVPSDTDEVIEWLRRENLEILVADTRASSTIYEADLSRALAFVFGNEAEGASDKLKGAADMLLKIPIHGRAESLNVASSAAICLYEAIRQRGLKHG